MIAVHEQPATDTRAALVQLQTRYRSTLDEFARISYGSHTTWQGTRWLGVPVLKHPCDLWIYQEVIHEVRPGLIIETGTAFGGSALYFASILDHLGGGRWVYSIDVRPAGELVPHDRVAYVGGDSLAPFTIADAKAFTLRHATGRPVMVTLDSDHSYEHVLAECHAYAELVTPGSFLVVEDTNLSGHPVRPDLSEGPFEAVRDFLHVRDDFVAEPLCERYLITHQPGGWLRRAA